MQPNVHISNATTFPRSAARRNGESTFSQMSFVSSGAGPRSGNEAGVMFAVVLQAVIIRNRNPANAFFMGSYLVRWFHSKETSLRKGYASLRVLLRQGENKL